MVSVRGSRRKFRKGDATIVVPHPKKDPPAGTAPAIAKDAGWISGEAHARLGDLCRVA